MVVSICDCDAGVFEISRSARRICQLREEGGRKCVHVSLKSDSSLHSSPRNQNKIQDLKNKSFIVFDQVSELIIKGDSFFGDLVRDK